MIRYVISKNERDGLAFLNVYAAHYAFTQHALPLLLLEHNYWNGLAVVLATIDCDIQLELDVFTGECYGFARGAPRWMVRKEDFHRVFPSSIVESRKDLDLFDMLC